MRTPYMALTALTALAVFPVLPALAQVAVHAETIYTMAGAPLKDGVVLVGKDGKIERVGLARDVRIPSGYKTLTAKVVTPGLVDAHSVVGLAGMLNQDHDQDQLEKSDPMQPELRAVDAYNAREPLVAYLQSFGITTVHTGHGPGALLSGQTMVVKTRGNTVADAVVDSATMVAATLGPDVSRTFAPKSPGTRSKGVAMLRGKLIKAQEYRDKLRGADSTKRPARDLGLETLAKVLDHKMPLLVTGHSVSEILAALRLAKEFSIDVVLDGASEAYLVVGAIKAAGVPVIIHPTMLRNTGSSENASLETAKTLVDAGIPVALQSGFEGYVPKTRVVLFEAAMAAANGLTMEQALRTVTIDAAKVIGQSQRVGSLETGKDGDLALFDGDPFEFTSHVCGVVIEGVVVRESCR